MTGQMKREILLQLIDGSEVTFLSCLCEAIESGIGVAYVGCVVLVVVQFE